MKSFIKMWANALNFKGETKIGEFLTALLINHLLPLVLYVVVKEWIIVYFIISIIPVLSMIVRRLNDSGRGAKTLWFIFLPIIGWFIIIFALLSTSLRHEDKEFDKYHW